MKRIRVQGINSLKENSLRITGRYPIVCGEKIGIFDPTEELREVTKAFRECDGIMTFVDDGVMYVIPDCQTVRQILKEENFHRDSFLVMPFLYEAYPEEETEKKKWESLYEWGKNQQRKDDRMHAAMAKKMGARYCRIV